MEEVSLTYTDQPLQLQPNKRYRITVTRTPDGYNVSCKVAFDPATGQPQDTIVVKSQDGSFEQSHSCANGTAVDGGIQLTFTGVLPGKQYDMYVVPAGDDQPFYIFRNAEATETKLQQLAGGS